MLDERCQQRELDELDADMRLERLKQMQRTQQDDEEEHERGAVRLDGDPARIRAEASVQHEVLGERIRDAGVVDDPAAERSSGNPVRGGCYERDDGEPRDCDEPCLDEGLAKGSGHAPTRTRRGEASTFQGHDHTSRRGGGSLS